MSTTDDLKNVVAQEQNVKQATVKLVSGIAQLVKNAVAQGEQAVRNLVSQLEGDTHGLAAAVTENTPAADGGGAVDNGGTSGTGGTAAG